MVSGVSSVPEDKDNYIVQGNINKITNRAAMGLPEHYVKCKAETIHNEMKEVRSWSEKDLLCTVDDPAQTMTTRLASGLILAVIGDPRINCLNPAMVTIPKGIATIGVDSDRVDYLHEQYKKYGVQRNWLEKECPRFQYPIKSFRIGKFPVTNNEFRLFLEKTGSEHLPTSWCDGRMAPYSENSPVYTVTPEAADAYTLWLSEETGRRFRLPTEYEWEYAAGGVKGLDYPWGETFIEGACNTLETGLVTATPVGMFPMGTSPFGVEDMAGNVEEYVSSCYEPYPGGHLVEDDLYTLLGYYRIARGGAFNRFKDLARCQRRHGPYPKSLYAMGFRLAEEL